MSRRSLLKDLGRDEEAIIVAWIADKHEDKIVLRDASGYREFRVKGSKDLSELPLETLVVIEGEIRDDILFVKKVIPLTLPRRERGFDYTSVTRDTDPVAAAKYSPWVLRSKLLQSVVRLQQYILEYVREFLYREGFTELLPPIASVVSDPGLRGARKLRTSLYGVEYELTSSVIMYKQSSAAVFEKIFYVARNIREEPPENIGTGRHLVEFTQIDLEWALASVDDVIRLAERLLEYVSEKLAREKSWLYGELGVEPYVFKPPFPRLTYDEALEVAKRLGYSVEWGKELSHEAETAIAMEYDSPVWITGFPVVSRGFYYLPDPDSPRYNRDFNLILPRGYGEVIDGGEREYRYEELVKRIKAVGEPLEKYEWFLDLARAGGIPPSAGWGLGLERLTRFLAGLKHVGLATPFPKLPDVAGTP